MLEGLIVEEGLPPVEEGLTEEEVKGLVEEVEGVEEEEGEEAVVDIEGEEPCEVEPPLNNS
jgi:hypothetical protein